MNKVLGVGQGVMFHSLLLDFFLQQISPVCQYLGRHPLQYSPVCQYLGRHPLQYSPVSISRTTPSADLTYEICR
jgi:hypothetical protein